MRNGKRGERSTCRRHFRTPAKLAEREMQWFSLQYGLKFSDWPELGVNVETYITVMEDRCTMEEAKIIFDGIWFEEDETTARALFASKL
jgi:hypothetical protein